MIEHVGVHVPIWYRCGTHRIPSQSRSGFGDARPVTMSENVIAVTPYYARGCAKHTHEQNPTTLTHSYQGTQSSDYRR